MIQPQKPRAEGVMRNKCTPEYIPGIEKSEYIPESHYFNLIFDTWNLLQNVNITGRHRNQPGKNHR